MIYDENKKKKRETKTYNERYNEDAQRLYINMLLSDPEAFTICRSILKEDYFDDRLRPAINYILDHTEKYKKLPAVEMVKATTGVSVQKFSEGELHTDSLMKEIENFCKYKAMEIAVLDSVELLQSGRAGEIVERTKDALTISLMSDLGTDYYRDPETRLLRMKDKSSLISTGWQALDDKLYGGLSRGGLHVFAGRSGEGKSLFLQNIALNWSLMGLNVLYITLELSEELVSVRLDAMITGRGTKEVMSDVKETALMIRTTDMSKKPGRIYIKKLPEGGTTINTIRAYVTEFQIKTGLKPDAIVIDYLDLLYPNNGRIDPSDHFIKDKYVSEEMRGLMGELNCFSATASQLNRGASEATEYDHSHIAGGISKINTADNVFGIFAPFSLREKGIMKLQFLKTRSSSAVGQHIELSYDPVCMRISDPLFAVDDTNPLSKEALKQFIKSNSTSKPSNSSTKISNSTGDNTGTSSVLSRLRQKSGVRD